MWNKTALVMEGCAMDCRERLISEFQNRLLSDFEVEDIRKIRDILTISLADYDVSERCTDVAVVDNKDIILIKNYCGSLLVEGKRRKTVEQYASFLKMFVGEIEKPLLELDSNDIRLFLATKRQKLKESTCQTYRNYLSAFYKWLAQEEYINKNPMAKIKPQGKKNRKRGVYSSTELYKLRCACNSISQRAMLEIFISTGIRIEELSKLDITDVDICNKSIYIRDGKGGRSRIVYIDDLCKDILGEYMLKQRSDGLPALFVSRIRKRKSTNAISCELKKLGKRAGVNDCHAHKFRHTFATRLAKRGAKVQTIQALLGHSQLSTTMIYIEQEQQMVKSEYEMFN